MTNTAHKKCFVSVIRIRNINCYLGSNHETFLFRMQDFFSYDVCVIRNGRTAVNHSIVDVIVLRTLDLGTWILESGSWILLDLGSCLDLGLMFVCVASMTKFGIFLALFSYLKWTVVCSTNSKSLQ
jgi:hypothetical protein